MRRTALWRGVALKLAVTINSDRLFRAAAHFSALALGMGIFFRHHLTAPLARVFGDIGDARINIALLEHWFRTLKGQAAWRDPIFFHPTLGALGYTDAYALFVLPYAGLRSLGVEPALAFEGAIFAIKLVGYVSFFALLRRYVVRNEYLAIFGALLFTIWNSYYYQMLHIQFVAYCFAPLLMIWMLKACETPGEASHPLIYAVLSGALFAMLFFSAFYVAYFLAVALMLLAAALAVMVLTGAVEDASFSGLTRSLTKPIVVFVAAFLVCIVPFLLTYLPKLAETGGQGIAPVRAYALLWPEIVNVTSENWLWGGRLIAWMRSLGVPPPADYERFMGIGPLTLIAIVAAGMGLAVARIGLRLDLREALLLSALLAGVATTLLSLRFGRFAGWELLFHVLPGANAVRVPSRLLLLAPILGIPILIYMMERLTIWGAELTGALHRRMVLGVLIVSASLLAVEQINTANLAQISRRAERILTRVVPPPPASCRYFFVAKELPRDKIHPLYDDFYNAQIDAMLVAMRTGLPTINGVSTWLPPGWALQDVESPQYLSNVAAWIESRRLAPQDACGLDLAAGRWAVNPFAR